MLAVTLDASFGDNGIVTTNLGTQPSHDSAQDIVAVQPDGKTLVAGYGGPNDFIVVRYNTDGSLDTSFDSDGKATVDFAGSSDLAYALAVDTDGKIVVAGRSYTGSSWDFGVARLNTDGSLDTSFDADGKATIDFGGTQDHGYDMAMAADGKILVAGWSYQMGNWDFGVARLNADGTLDTSFDSDGKVTLDFGGSHDYAYGVATDADGKVVVAGYRQTGYDFAVARFNTDGSLDTSFDGDGRATIDFGSSSDFARDVAIDANGKIVIGGYSYQGSSRHDFAVARLNPNGSLDGSFSGDGKVSTDFSGSTDQAYGVAVADDGDVILVGRAYQGYPTYHNFALARYDSNGNLDGSFGSGGRVTTDVNGTFINRTEAAYGVDIDAGGNIIVAGESYNSLNNTQDFTVARYAANGTLDPSFDGDGIVRTDIERDTSEYVEDVVALQPDGKILVLSQVSVPVREFALVRYNVDGSIDSTFGSGGTVTDNFGGSSSFARAITVGANGKIVVAGGRHQAGLDFAVARFNPDGSLDTSFDGDGKVTVDFGGTSDFASTVAMDASGKILVAGRRWQAGGDFAVARLNTDGSLDTSFDGDGKTTIDFGSTSDIATDMAIAASGKIVVAGRTYQGSSSRNDFAVARLNANGSLDLSFDSDGRVTTDVGGSDDYLEGVAIDAAGRIVVTGELRIAGNDWDFGLVRYNDDGSLDTSFDGDGIVTSDFSGGYYDGSYDIVIDGSGKYVVGGEAYDASDGTYDFALARYTLDGTLDPTFDDGDGLITMDVEGYQYVGFWRLAIDPAGRIIGGGWAGAGAGDDIILARYTTSQPPTVTVDNATVTVGEGTTVTNTGSFNDVDLGDNVTISADIGTITFQDTGKSGTWTWQLPTTDDIATTTVTITADDGNGGMATTAFDFTVNNVAPHDVVIADSVGELVFAVGSTETFAGSFKDASPDDTHGNPATGDAVTYWTFTHLDETGTLVTETRPATVTQASGSGTVSDDFSYTEAGVYQVTLTVTDDDGGATTSATSIFVVYDPSAGFVTGGGWIASPAGADRANPTATGKANFGFVSKYKKGATTPTGQTEFQFKAGGLNFHSGSYEWLVVSGARAKYKGVGTINGGGDYGFMLTAIDGQVNGGGGVDKFRIKIWDRVTGALRYDNQDPTDADDDATPSTALSGGQIMIHTKGGKNELASVVGAHQLAESLQTRAQLEPIVEQAIGQWARAGHSELELAKLRQTEFHLANFSDTRLGMASNSTNVVWIDTDAAGHGWIIDAGSPLTMRGSSYGMDLLTVVTHELGHMLGKPDLDPHRHPDHVMSGVLNVGDRRLPTSMRGILIGTEVLGRSDIKRLLSQESLFGSPIEFKTVPLEPDLERPAVWGAEAADSLFAPRGSSAGPRTRTSTDTIDGEEDFLADALEDEAILGELAIEHLP